MHTVHSSVHTGIVHLGMKSWSQLDYGMEICGKYISIGSYKPRIITVNVGQWARIP